MTSGPLARLCARRGVDERTDLLDLAPVLNLRPADLLAIAGGDIPARYLPVAPTASRQIERVCGGGLEPAASVAMRQYADSLPRPPAGPAAVGRPAGPTATFGVVFQRLMLVRNLTRKALAMATVSAQSTINIVMTDHRLPSRPRLLLIASALCLTGDDVEAMAARPVDHPPADAAELEFALAQVPRLWALGELVWALAPLTADQINDVIAFGLRAP